MPALVCALRADANLAVLPLLWTDSYLTSMSRHSSRSTDRRLYADPVVREKPDMARLVELVLHLAENQHHAASLARVSEQSPATESTDAEALVNDSEAKEQ